MVDQPASIGALPEAVTRAYGHQIAYLTGLVERGWPTYTPARRNTRPRRLRNPDAARILSHALRTVDAGNNALAEAEMQGRLRRPLQ
jgi:hypothetical protein